MPIQRLELEEGQKHEYRTMDFFSGIACTILPAIYLYQKSLTNECMDEQLF